VTHDPRRRLPACRPRPRGGFTLLEILVVVVILAVLAILVIPQFISAVTDSKENSLRMNLHRIRMQIEIYKQEHGRLPELTRFGEQMTGPTDAAGTPVAVGTADSLGPYLRELPYNPMNDMNTVADTAPGTSGWYYDQTTGDFHANDSAASREY